MITVLSIFLCNQAKLENFKNSSNWTIGSLASQISQEPFPFLDFKELIKPFSKYSSFAFCAALLSVTQNRNYQVFSISTPLETRWVTYWGQTFPGVSVRVCLGKKTPDRPLP